MKMSNKIYDVLKWLTMVVLPAGGIFYSALAKEVETSPTAGV